MVKDGNTSNGIPGITRCDMIAEAVIGAAEQFGDIPIVVRLQGTNSEKGQEMVCAARVFP